MTIPKKRVIAETSPVVRAKRLPFAPKPCEKCGSPFVPTGNCKRCPECRRTLALETAAGRFAPKTCPRCTSTFVPTGRNCTYCAPCRRPAYLESMKARWHRTYVKKGYNQARENNNAWKGGTAPSSYRQIAFEYYGEVCQRCLADDEVDETEEILVHHRNEVRSDNRVENLEPICTYHHQMHHGCADNLPDLVVFKPRACKQCSRTFQPTGTRDNRCPRCRTAFGPSRQGFKPRRCEVCKAMFQPKGARGERCPSCRTGQAAVRPVHGRQLSLV